MEKENKVKQTMKMEVRGARAKGRPRMRWMDNIRHDMNKCSLEVGEDGGGWYGSWHPSWTRENAKNKKTLCKVMIICI